MILLILMALILTGCAAAPASHPATLTWEPNHEQHLAGYRLYRGTLHCEDPEPLTEPIATIPVETTYTDPDAQEFVCYELTALSASGAESAHSNRVIRGQP